MADEEKTYYEPKFYGKPYKRAEEIPAPPPFNAANAWKTIGPGFIVLSLSIGSGEWLMGPASVISYGTFVLWIVTIGIITQAVFNMTCIRYTLYTGEPIMVGFTRLSPGPMLWAPIWIFISFISIGPGWASGAATALGSLIVGRVAGPEDQGTVMIAGMILFLAVVAILMFGGKIETWLEAINKWIVFFIFGSLLILVIAFAPASAWWDVFTGFFQFGKLPPGETDWFLLAGLAGYAGAGGILNMGVTNWYRDKGFGMGSVVGYIPSAIGGKEIRVSNVGYIPPANKTTFERFNHWWKYSLIDQLGVWALGAFIGMFLCVLLAYAMVPVGTAVGGWGAAAMQAEGVGKVWGGFGWAWVLFIGFMVLFGSQLSNSETFVRQVTDVLWNTSDWFREKVSRDDIRRLYYLILVLFTIWSIWLFFQGSPLFLVAFMANAANLAFTVAGIQLFFMERVYPPEIKTPLWQKLILVVLILFYGAFTFIGFGTQFFGLQM